MDKRAFEQRLRRVETAVQVEEIIITVVGVHPDGTVSDEVYEIPKPGKPATRGKATKGTKVLPMAGPMPDGRYVAPTPEERKRWTENILTND